MQAFVSQFAPSSADQDAPLRDQEATAASVAFSAGQRRGTADTLVHAARTHLLHRKGPSTVHPNSRLLHQSFELLEGSSKKAEVRLSAHIDTSKDMFVCAPHTSQQSSKARIGSPIICKCG
jgi:hypothetical protein